MINNYFIKGRSSENNEFVTDFAATDKVYHAGNYWDSDEVDQGDDKFPEGRLVNDNDFTSNGATVCTTLGSLRMGSRR